MATNRRASAIPAAAWLGAALLAGCGSPQHSARELIVQAGGSVEWKQAKIRGIRLTRVPDASGVLAKLPAIDTVTVLELAETDVDDQALQRLPAWPLRRLDLRATRVTDRGVQKLTGWPSLAWLSLSATKIKQIDALASLQQLEVLALPPAADDRALRIAARLPRLRTLYAAETSIDGAGLAHLTPTAVPRLRTLHLDNTDIDDDSLPQLPMHAGLERVTLAATRVGDGAASHLASFPKLDYLDFSGTQLSDVGLIQLAKLKLLYVLDVPETNVTLAGIRQLEEQRPGIQIAHSLEEPSEVEQPSLIRRE